MILDEIGVCDDDFGQFIQPLSIPVQQKMSVSEPTPKEANTDLQQQKKQVWWYRRDM